jgi:hypothetical protein
MPDLPPPAQVPLPYVADLGATLDFVGNRKVHVAQQKSGLEKRQATVQMCFHPSGQHRQPRIAVIFRGAGNVPKSERDAYDDRVDVYFQVCQHAMCAIRHALLPYGYTPLEHALVLHGSDAPCAAARAQAKAWMDRDTTQQWARRTLKHHLKDVGGLNVERVLFMDNLDAQARLLRLPGATPVCNPCLPSACATASAATTT